MKKSRHIRIIGGRWKRRQIRFPEIGDLRPSPDAVRETLFNWLHNDLADSDCLDLYAGSGAFGFEAISRGAAAVVMVESNRQVIRSLQDSRNLLNADQQVEIYHSQASQYLKSTVRKFDVVFIDPPFIDFDVSEICHSLVDHNILNDKALVYIESPKSKLPLPIPPTWHIIRESKRGLVQSTLIST